LVPTDAKKLGNRSRCKRNNSHAGIRAFF